MVGVARVAISVVSQLDKDQSCFLLRRMMTVLVVLARMAVLYLALRWVARWAGAGRAVLLKLDNRPWDIEIGLSEGNRRRPICVLFHGGV